VKELVALAKAKPGALTYSSAGAGTMSHLAMELFSLRTGVKLTHLPYKGAAPASIGLLSGEAQLAFVVMPVAQVQINAGKLRGLAVAARIRSAVVPQVPTLQEAGVANNEALQWNGLFAPAKTPQAILDRLHREVVRALGTPEVKQRFEAEGADPVASTPAEFAAFFHAEAAKWSEVAKKSGTKLD
jgi:tripartite-type tricarboxylate transporter receptor subunit TctC